MKEKTGRIWELDLLRGIALVFMIYFHIVYDLKEIFNYSIIYESGINYYIGKAAGILFIFAAGISSTLTRSNPARAVRILIIAMVITIITHIYDPHMGIKFGILHFLGVSILTAPLIKRMNESVLLILGTAVIAVSLYISGINVNHDTLFALGLTTGNFISSDFYPLFPWYGVFLYGLSAGKVLYTSKKSIFTSRPQKNILTKAGRRSLLIYLLHQPVILAVLTLYTYLNKI